MPTPSLNLTVAAVTGCDVMSDGDWSDLSYYLLPGQANPSFSPITFQDPRGKLLSAGMRFIQRNRPRLSIMENVKGLTSSRHKKTFNGLLKAFDRMGYETYYRTLDTRSFGLPHCRERLYLVAIRKDSLKRAFEWPEGRDTVPLSSLLDPFNSKTDKAGRLPVASAQRALAIKAFNDAHSDGYNPKTYALAVDVDASPRYAVTGYEEIKCLTRTRGASGGPWLSCRGRRTTLAELLRLQGFNAEEFQLNCVPVSARQMGGMLGNTMSLPVVKAVLIQGLWAAGLTSRKLAEHVPKN